MAGINNLALEPYPHSYIIDTDGDLKLDNPTVYQVFGGLVSTLDKIKSCSVKKISDIYDKKNLNLIIDHAHKFPPAISLLYINDALRQISQIEALGDSVVINVKRESHSYLDIEKFFGTTEDKLEITEDWLKISTKLFIDDLIKKTQKELEHLKCKILEIEQLINANATTAKLATIPACIGTQSLQKVNAQEAYSSFNYVQYNECQCNITQLKNELVSAKLIDDSTTLSNFRKVFIETKIDAPIKWTGTATEFAYFIKILCKKQKIKVAYKLRWKVACYCFVRSDGTAFDRPKLRLLKRPSNARDIEVLVNIL